MLLSGVLAPFVAIQNPDRQHCSPAIKDGQDLWCKFAWENGFLRPKKKMKYKQTQGGKGAQEVAKIPRLSRDVIPKLPGSVCCKVWNGKADQNCYLQAQKK